MNKFDHYIILEDKFDSGKILSAWTWLTANKTLIALTKMGDALLKDDQNKLYHLDTGNGTLQLVSENFMDFMDGKLDDEIYEEILLPDLFDKLNNMDKKLNPNQVYTFYKIPLVGGEYAVDNIYPLDLFEHYSLSGEVHIKLKDLPDGTKVTFKAK